jgi:hypothetical protein
MSVLEVIARSDNFDNVLAHVWQDPWFFFPQSSADQEFLQKPVNEMEIAHHCTSAILQLNGPSATKSMRAQDAQNHNYSGSHEFGIFTVHHPVNDVQLNIMKTMSTNVDAACLRDVLTPLILQQHKVSLRLLDYFVTNFCRRRAVAVKTLRGHPIVVFHEYKRALAYYRRRNFDPFRRSKRRLDSDIIAYNVTYTMDNKTYTTTIGQLCFINWAHRNGIIAWVAKHADELEKYMTQPKMLKNGLSAVSAVRCESSSFAEFNRSKSGLREQAQTQRLTEPRLGCAASPPGSA